MNGPPRTKSRRPPPPPRDQEISGFTGILERLIQSVPGAKGAAIVDGEGETVDYAGPMDPFELKICAAHWQIVLGDLRETRHFAELQQITVRARGRSYVIRQLPERYALVIVLHRHAAFAGSERTFEEIDAALYAEVGWPRPSRSAKWFRVDVETQPHDHSRPRRLRAAGRWLTIEVMGSMVGLRRREKGFRVRLPSGAEMLLVRECRGRWYADEHIEDLT
ncbi:roadblock/LC7 domain-containing protein [Polyangium aurulentum]|uniref:roadblock/LC7 domain-containing protein n=1 Tax=Polyangium aurulentum TaxID=2567896 RepID=UPI0010AE6EE6|nr:roadblock/LC7 domain-containing protein [Polyangium aurulentum]UQA59262.1 roadblock/LC7 domain-containing protein [Polyangium aurulentum]